MGPSFQIGHGASGRNEGYGASGWLHTEVLTQPNQGPTINVSSGDFNVDLGTGCDLCAEPAMLGDGVIDTEGTSRSSCPGSARTSSSRAPPLRPVPRRHRPHDRRDFPPDFPGQRFQFEVTFNSHKSPGMFGYPPPYSPKLQLPRASTPKTVARSIPRTGPTTKPSRAPSRALATSPAARSASPVSAGFQIGIGASGKSAEFGASGWLDLQIISHPDQGDEFTLAENSHGDINITLRDGCR